MSARTRVLPVIVAVLVLAAVAGAIGYTSLQVKDADRTVSTKLWRTTKARPPKAPAPAHALGGKQLPPPAGYRLGPDIQEYGNDTVLTSRQATAVFKASGRGLPPAQRQAQGAAVEKLRLKGIGMRSYAAERGGLVAEVQLAQMENKAAAAGIAAYRAQVANSLRGFRKGPRIEGHRGAECFLLPTSKNAPIDAMYCTATEGDLLVTMTAYGGPRSDAATLLGKQLEHVEGPGESV
ncbi:hypothetical protein G5C51_09205 [Streptomyces sp. A7024]|uniref:Secreted protein n=1 Tax=Streptomyces coryli TaxID=1128680 RepID=A0A6G4TX34_9ACTN|nr:hypothetical protein [Streptomyces coryli]NGN64080.1 hypothetical protein [Streptomyces coryli]